MGEQAAQFEQLLAQTLVPDSEVIKAVCGAYADRRFRMFRNASTRLLLTSCIVVGLLVVCYDAHRQRKTSKSLSTIPSRSRRY